MDKDRTGLFAPEKESSMAGMFVFYETFATKMSTQQISENRMSSNLIIISSETVFISTCR